MTAREGTIDATTPDSSAEGSGVAVPSAPARPVEASSAPALDPRSKARRVFDAALPLLLLFAIAAIDFPLCPTRLFFGIPCPGCGLTRATVAMLTLDFHAMVHFHPLAPLMAPIVGWALGKPILEELGWIPKHRVFVRVPQSVWIAITIAFFALYALRFAGLLGGLPDPVDPGHGLLAETVTALF